MWGRDQRQVHVQSKRSDNRHPTQAMQWQPSQDVGLGMGWGESERRAEWVGQLRIGHDCQPQGLVIPWNPQKMAWRSGAFFFFMFSYTLFLELESKGQRENRAKITSVAVCQAIHSICNRKLPISIFLRFWQEKARFSDSEGCKTLSLTVSRGSCLPMTSLTPQEGHNGRHLLPLPNVPATNSHLHPEQ